MESIDSTLFVFALLTFGDKSDKNWGPGGDINCHQVPIEIWIQRTGTSFKSFMQRATTDGPLAQALMIKTIWRFARISIKREGQKAQPTRTFCKELIY